MSLHFYCMSKENLHTFSSILILIIYVVYCLIMMYNIQYELYVHAVNALWPSGKGNGFWYHLSQVRILPEQFIMQSVCTNVRLRIAKSYCGI